MPYTRLDFDGTYFLNWGPRQVALLPALSAALLIITANFANTNCYRNTLLLQITVAIIGNLHFGQITTGFISISGSILTNYHLKVTSSIFQSNATSLPCSFYYFIFPKYHSVLSQIGIVSHLAVSKLLHLNVLLYSSCTLFKNGVMNYLLIITGI